MLTLLLPAAVASPVCGQSLADAARREKERRAKLSSEPRDREAISFDDADLKSGRGDTANATKKGEPRASEADATARSASEPKRPTTELDREYEQRKQAEARWRSEALKARARLENARSARAALDELYLVEGEYYVDDEGKAVIRDLQHLRQLVAAADAEVAAAERAIEDMHTRARRASVPPGWLR